MWTDKGDVREGFMANRGIVKVNSSDDWVATKIMRAWASVTTKVPYGRVLAPTKIPCVKHNSDPIE